MSSVGDTQWNNLWWYPVTIMKPWELVHAWFWFETERLEERLWFVRSTKYSICLNFKGEVFQVEMLKFIADLDQQTKTTWNKLRNDWPVLHIPFNSSSPRTILGCFCKAWFLGPFIYICPASEDWKNMSLWKGNSLETINFWALICCFPNRFIF